MVGKALDDRVLLAVMTEVLRRVPPAELGCELTLAATVQEEIGLIGAQALAAREAFDAAIILEIGLAGDVPGVGRHDAAAAGRRPGAGAQGLAGPLRSPADRGAGAGGG